jgi:peptide/nickel transport system substrate-binding protein
LTGLAETRAVIFVALAATTLVACNRGAPAARENNSSPQGGSVTVSIQSEPQSFNRFVKRDTGTDLVMLLTQARLVRVNRSTQDVEPWLAERWTRSDDGLRYTITLRSNVTFSDGHPLTADDVVFSLAAARDPKARALTDVFEIAGKPLQLAVADPRTVVMTLPAPYGPGVRILDNLPIYPKHKLEDTLKNGTFSSAWGVTTPPGELVGLGPFVLSQYVPGQRLVFARNPRFFQKDSAGVALPYLDRITVEIIPDQSAETLAFESGRIDMTTDRIRPEDYGTIKRAADEGRAKILDLGVTYDADSLWFNLKRGVFAADPRGAWLQRDELRQAISLAVDRKIFADTVYLGAGVPVLGPLTSANKKWFAADLPAPAHDPDRARTLLASIGLRDRDGDGRLDDASGNPVRFTLLTQKGRIVERGAAVIRDELKKIGITVDVVALEGGALVQQFTAERPTYDAVYFSLVSTDTDPANNPDFWFSGGSAHVWNIGQKTPATEWERDIDQLMTRQVASSDEHERKALFDQVQKVFVAHLPTVQFVAPTVLVATSARVGRVMPGLIRPQILWAPEAVSVLR